MAEYPRTVMEFRDWFADEAACRDYLFRLGVAGRLLLPGMQWCGSLGYGAGLASLPGVQSADLGDGGDLVRRYAFALAFMVRSALASRRSQPRPCQRNPP